MVPNGVLITKNMILHHLNIKNCRYSVKKTRIDQRNTEFLGGIGKEKDKNGCRTVSFITALRQKVYLYVIKRIGGTGYP